MWKRRIAFGTVLVALVGTLTAYHLNRSKLLFAQVVFGPEARLRIWFILDGNSLYVDRSSGGTPRKAERLPWPTGSRPSPCGEIELVDPDGSALRTHASPGFQSRASASISGYATIVGGFVDPGYDGSEQTENLASLNFTGPLTIGGNAELFFTLDGLVTGGCTQITCTTTIVVNQNPTDHAYLFITTWNRRPPQNWAYNIMLGYGGGVIGHDFDATRNQFFGYGAMYNISAIPTEPLTLTSR